MSKIITGLIFLVALTFVFLSISCNNPVSADPVAYYIQNPPIIPGIVITGEIDPTPLGIWGNPQPKYWLGDYHLDAPFPNPTDYSSKIYFQLPERTYISIWIVRGRLPSENLENNFISGNGYFKTATKHFGMKLLEGYKNAGSHFLEINSGDWNGKKLDEGVYRIYLEVNGELLWQDLMVYDSDNGYPFNF